jgi:hypothetical protein
VAAVPPSNRFAEAELVQAVANFFEHQAHLLDWRMLVYATENELRLKPNRRPHLPAQLSVAELIQRTRPLPKEGEILMAPEMYTQLAVWLVTWLRACRSDQRQTLSIILAGYHLARKGNAAGSQAA